MLLWSCLQSLKASFENSLTSVQLESPKETMVRERAEKIFEEIIAESFPNLMKTVNSRSKKLSHPQAHTYTKKRRKKKKTVPRYITSQIS